MERLVQCRNRYFSILANFVVFISCTQPANHQQNVLPATVPVVFNLSSESGFTKRQDTLYYQGIKYCGYAYKLYDNGDTMLLKGYMGGLEEGWQKKWYPDGQLQELRYYINGKKNGTHTGWWENGKKKYEFSIMDDLNEGNFKEWNRDGRLTKNFNYMNGQEEGTEQLWWNDGAIRANYVVKNGKKYGLIGLKICVNKYDTLK